VISTVSRSTSRSTTTGNAWSVAASQLLALSVGILVTLSGCGGEPASRPSTSSNAPAGSVPSTPTTKPTTKMGVYGCEGVEFDPRAEDPLAALLTDQTGEAGALVVRKKRSRDITSFDWKVDPDDHYFIGRATLVEADRWSLIRLLRCDRGETYPDGDTTP